MKWKVIDLWNWITDLILLNVLWFVCCLPVVTAGASTAALWDVMLQRIRGEEPFAASDFFRAFRKNFKRATQVWGVLLCAGGVLAGNFLLCHVFRELQTLELVFLLLLLFLIGLSQYLFLLVSRTDRSCKELLRTAAALAVCYLPKSVMAALIALLPVMTVLIVQYALFGILLGVTFTAAFSTWLNGHILRSVLE